MSRVVHKQEVNVGRNELAIPEFAQLLSVQEQHGMFVLWYLCDPDAPKSKRVVVGIGTGHAFHDHHKMNYISTVQQSSFVFHFFEALS